MPNNDNLNKLTSSSLMIASELSDNTVVVTAEELNNKMFEQAMYDLEKQKHIFSAYLNDNTIANSGISKKELDDLANNPQTDILKVQKINSYVRKEVNKNNLVGKTYSAIESNLNTKVDLIFNSYGKNRNKNKMKEKAEEIIQEFNETINLEDLITKAVPMTFLEGNYPMYLRQDGDDYKVDYYPIGLVEVSDYEVSGEPYLLMNIKELTSRLRKVNKRNNNGTYLFFKSVDEEIKNNYPIEVYQGYKNKDSYAKLKIENTGIVRINSLGRKYGVSPIFSTISPSLMLDSFKLSDEQNNKARGKKIIFQKTREKLLGDSGDRKPYSEVMYSHNELLSALAQNDVSVISAMPWVEDIIYVEPKIIPTNVQNINLYRDEIATALGISYTTSTDKSGVAEISIKELMKTINRITSQLEKILKKWYKIVLRNNGIPLEYTPNVKIVDSELMNLEMKIQLSGLLFNTLGTSYRTIYDILDIDYEQEIERRKLEAENGVEEIFKPRLTSFTANKDSLNNKNSNNNESNNGREPNSKDKDKQQYDKQNNKDIGKVK